MGDAIHPILEAVLWGAVIVGAGVTCAYSLIVWIRGLWK